jgi:hypothetical protein
MKRLIISAIAAGSLGGVAHADITVMAPKQPVTQEAADAYVAELDTAVKRVCLKTNSPIIGSNYFGYLGCLKATRADVAKKDPTGIFASRQPIDSTVLATR